tara:strand:+ start:69 stop:533 length:465 start_codon:yes stop_codon:yes gene_type:complete
MENEVENTVEETQEDNTAIKQMRERIKELEKKEKEYESVKMDTVIQNAGFDPASGQGKALKDLYKGELEVDSVKKFAEENYGWSSETPTEVTEEQAQKSRVVTSQESLDTVIEASVPLEPVGIDDQIAQAQQDGDWQTSSNLKAEQLRAITQKK